MHNMFMFWSRCCEVRRGLFVIPLQPYFDFQSNRWKRMLSLRGISHYVRFPSDHACSDEAADASFIPAREQVSVQRWRSVGGGIAPISKQHRFCPGGQHLTCGLEINELHVFIRVVAAIAISNEQHRGRDAEACESYAVMAAAGRQCHVGEVASTGGSGKAVANILGHLSSGGLGIPSKIDLDASLSSNP